MIYGKNVFLKLKNKIVLDGVNFEIMPNKITCFLGNNGSGKTSLLRCILNLHHRYKGQILFEQKNIKKLCPILKSKNISFVFQEFNLFNNLSVLQNCLFPIQSMYKSEEEAVEKVIQVLKELDILNLKDHYPSKLSHGQKQKAAIARSLCLNPKILILDEPTASLDNESTKNLSDLLLNLKNNGMTIALTSHDQLFVDSIYDCVYHLDNGKIINFFEKKYS